MRRDDCSLHPPFGERASTFRTEEIIPGLWSIPVAIPIRQLQVTFVYALQVPDGLVLVDAGWSSGASLASLESGMAAIGASLGDVRGVLFTHAHGDHYGLAAPLRERTGAWLALHSDDLPIIERQRAPTAAAAEFRRWLILIAGAEDNALWEQADAYAQEFPPALPDRALADGERLALPGWELTVLHTPGHSPGHVCFVDRHAGFVLTGDHVLARTTPHVAAWAGEPEDVVADYLHSLQTVQDLGDLLALPAHEERMPSVAARAEELIAHHHRQLATAHALVAAGFDTVRAVAERMPWSQAWPELRGYAPILALGEAQAHLVTLENRGEIHLIDDDPPRWSMHPA